jgi:hypothetical protein
MSKISFKKWKKIYYFDAFPSKKHFEKQHLPQFQTNTNNIEDLILNKIDHD